MLIELLPLILLGFGLGMVHALDADHVMAVSALNNQQQPLWRTIWFSGHWALGHAGILLAAGVLLFGLGVVIPESLQQLAEVSVALLLIAVGCYSFWQFRQAKVTVTIHQHGELKHSHWHDSDHLQSSAKNTISDSHVPIMVGSLHGLAGSAPALALIPVASHGDFTIVVAYLMMFSFGVMLSMMLFGLGLGTVQRMLSQSFHSISYWSRRVVALLSTLVGFFWLYKAI